MARIRLRSLKLTGFKSFPDEVELTFPGKVSAIIGPNGCGKSNLVDAILWVLGEQSPSLMRLKQMGDVVFTGASSRAAAGVAEVTLVLESDDGHWKEADGCLEVRRRVFRTGPSEYRLNGRSVRLKDIFEELAGVGLGTRAYSIIEQGRVGQVLSARPIDRRSLLEEAAGITRYKARKHEAELKLEHTRQNLLRLEDVIGEVKRSLRQIKRQAKQAERHQKLEADLKDHLRRLFTIDAHLLDGQRTDIQKRRAQAQNEVAAAAAALAGSDADLGRAREGLDTARAETDAAREEVAKLLGSRERLEAFLERSADLLDNLRASLDHTRNEAATLRSSRGSLDDRIGEARRRVEDLQIELDAVAKGVAAADEAYQKADVLRTEAEQEAAQQRQDLLRTISTLTASRNRLGDLERESDRLEYALGQLGQDRTRLEKRHEELAGTAREAVDRSREAARAAEELASRRRDLSDERARLREEASSAKQEAESLGHSLWELRHRLQGVEREIARHAAATEQLAESIPTEQLAGQLGDYLHPSPELAPVFDRVWREWLELPIVRSTTLTTDQTTAFAGLEGRIRLIAAAEAPPVRDLPLPDGAEDLLLQAGIDSEHLGWVSRALPRTLRCNDSEKARELADELPEALVVCGDGIVRKGRVLEPTTRGDRLPGTLQLRTMQEELGAKIAEVGARTEELTGLHQEAATRLEGQTEELAELDTRAVAAEQERARTAAVEESLTQELGRVERELDSLAAEEDRSREQAANIEQRRERLVEEVSKLEERSVELEQAVEDAANRLAVRREETADALRELDRRRAEERLAEERTEAARAESNRLDEEAGALGGRVEKLEAEAGRLRDQQTGTEEEVVRSRTRLVEEQGLLAAAREHERRLAEQVDAIAARVTTLEKEVRVRRETHDREREVLHEIEVDQTRLYGDWERLRDHAADELGLAVEALLEGEPEADDDPEALRTDIEGLRAKIERLGPVNLLALKELDELEERSQFLGKQRKDLVEALQTLDETIREIDATCTERFVATFEQVNEVFAETFSSLFGGGTARLDLVDEDDPLESGIDITAQPPGKKNQSVQLLSGGEKALTALSLLISLFRIKPSPFCILDEVDAPLDDANVERFSDLVHAMTEHTQFVLVTHNRRTMARADLLYGVTMEEPGVSKVVSVRVEDPQKLREGETLLP
jgi:chromosome segregation protein